MVHHNFTCVIQVRATDEEKCKAARILHEVFPHWKVIRPQQELQFTTLEEKPQHTYYCLFLPLGIYCGFGAENIHHAYNKAAKYWGVRGKAESLNEKQNFNRFYKDERISVSMNERDFIGCNNTGKYREVTHTLMTKLVKAWREENS